MPEVSALDFAQNGETGQLDVDAATKDMLRSMGAGSSFTITVSLSRDLQVDNLSV